MKNKINYLSATSVLFKKKSKIYTSKNNMAVRYLICAFIIYLEYPKLNCTYFACVLSQKLTLGNKNNATKAAS